MKFIHTISASSCCSVSIPLLIKIWENYNKHVIKPAGLSPEVKKLWDMYTSSYAPYSYSLFDGYQHMVKFNDDCS